MIKDRSTIKWTALMLPEHVQSLKDALIDEERVKQPLLDEQESSEIEILICEAMEFNTPITFKVYNNGFTQLITGTAHYINHLKSQIIFQDEDGYFHHILFNNIISVQEA
ncbi:YolD-like family protein [Peribacillus loiseleuriae]|uniref:YolD-like family protein n=1 Tax=Peribacillus loiseleuriae TaxID=1679170 RepID=UPI003D03C42A